MKWEKEKREINILLINYFKIKKGTDFSVPFLLPFQIINIPINHAPM